MVPANGREKLAVIALLALLLVTCTAVEAAQELGANKVFYAYAPKPLRVASKLDVVGLTDGTKVSVYDITGETAKLVKEGTINKGALLTVDNEKEAYYKVIADKAVAVSVGAAAESVQGGPWGSMFYPSIEGSYVGKNFIFMVVSSGNVTYPYSGFTVYAVEDTSVTVKDVSGNEITSFAMSANINYSVGQKLIRRRQVVQVQSTGNIMIASWHGGRFTSMPSVTGNFIGKKFFGYINYYWITWEIQPGGKTVWSNNGGQGFFIVYAYEPAEVKVYDLSSGQMLYSKTLGNVGEYWFVSGPTPPPPVSPGEPPPTAYDRDLSPRHLRFESTGNIAVWSGDGGDDPTKISQPAFWGETADITFATGKDEKDFWFYAPKKAVIFAPTEVNVNVNGTSRAMKKDTYYPLTTGGYYHVTSNNPIIIEVMGGVGSDYYGTYLLSYADIPVTAPETGGEFPLWIAGAAAAVVAVVVVVVLMRQRGKKTA